MTRSVLSRLLTMALCLAIFVSIWQHWSDQFSPNSDNQEETLRLPKIFASARNRTLATSRVLVYNRVPKCSSTAMINLLHRLATANKFKVVVVSHPARSSQNDLRNPTNKVELLHSVGGLQNQNWSSVYIRHVRSPDWVKHGLHVNLVNMVRDPIQRMMSWFYFIRYNWTFKEGKLFR